MARKPDPATRYARDVVAGGIVAGPWVRLACERHLRDLEEGPGRGLEWRPEAAQRALDFFPECLRLAEGEHAGKPFVLQPWQQFVVGSLFGWYGADGFRRFRTCYAEIGKGNGKSPMAAGIGLYMLMADGEAAAQVYSAATTRDQAKIVWGDAEKMVDASPALKSRITKTVNNLAFMRTHSFFRPVSADASRLDGFRPHCVLADEVHEHPSAMVIDKMRAGFKGRRQPIIVEITNSGVDRNSICYQHHEYSRKILEGVVRNDGWFAYVCALDDDDDPFEDPSCWIKANPNLGVSITEKYLREQVEEAKGMPAKTNIVLRLNFCRWTQAVTRWIERAAWDACGAVVEEDELAGRECFAGVDLSSTTDITAVVYVFPETVEREVPVYPEDESGDEDRTVEPTHHATRRVQRYDVRCRFFVPEENMLQRAQRDRVPYDQWAKEGWIEATEGNVVDYDVIRRRVNEDGERFNIREIPIDRWNSTGLQTQLMGDGFTVVPFGQGYAGMSSPAKELERVLKAGLLSHGGNPVLTWMADNVAVETDAAGNIKPSKAKSTERIDGIVALVMAIGRAMVAGGGDAPSYDMFFLGA